MTVYHIGPHWPNLTGYLIWFRETFLSAQKHPKTVLSKVDDFATFKKVEVYTKNSIF